jgi:hypothetical protein
MTLEEKVELLEDVSKRIMFMTGKKRHHENACSYYEKKLTYHREQTEKYSAIEKHLLEYWKLMREGMV